MADDTNSGGLFGLLGPGLRYVKGRLRVLLGTGADEAAPGNKLPGTYPIDSTGAVDGNTLVFDAGTGRFVPGDGATSGVALAITAPTTTTPGDSAAVGDGTRAARNNHKHALPPFGTGAGEFLEGSADAGMLHKAVAETITGTKRLDAQLRITPDTYPPTVGVFGCDADGSDPRSLLSYYAYGGSGQYRSLAIGTDVAGATLDTVGLVATGLDTGNFAGITAEGDGKRISFSFATPTEALTGEWTVYVEYNALLFRNHMGTLAGADVAIAGYSAGDTATDKAGGGLDLKPGEGAGNAAGAVLRLYAGATSTTPGTARNGWVLGLTVGPTAVTLGVPLDAGANKLTNLGTPTSAADAATKSYVDGLATTAGAYTVGAGAGLTGGGAINTNPSFVVAYAPALKSATTTVSVSAATAPTTGQVLTAVDDHTATWQTPGGGTLAGDVTGAAGSNTLSGAISTSVAWSGLHTLTGTSGPSGSSVQLGVGTESTGANFSTNFWGLCGATAADSSHRGTYVILRGGTGWASDNVTAAGVGGSAILRGGDGGAGAATKAAGDARHAVVQGGDGGADNGGGGGAGGTAQLVGGAATGTGKSGGAATGTGGAGAGAGGGGGTAQWVGGAGGVSASSSASGTGGFGLVGGGSGGAGTASAVGGTGGGGYTRGGAGGAGTATTAAGAGGGAFLNAGIAGAANGGPGAAGAAVTLAASSATGSGSNAGGDISGTCGTATGSGTGGALSLTAGTGGSSAGAGGNASLDAGAAGAGGTAGTLSLGATNANSVTIGRSGKTTTVGGALAVTGAATLNGAVTLGDATGDDITVTGRVAATVDTKTNNSFDLGSSSRAWRTVYAATSVLTALVDAISAGTLSLGTGNATGVFIGKTGTTTTVNNALTVGEAFTANGNVTLGDATSDAVTILGIPVLPKLTTTARDALTPAEAMLVYNTTTKKLNFYDTTAWREVTSP